MKRNNELTKKQKAKIKEFTTIEDFHEEQMKNPEYAKEFKAFQPEMGVIRAIIAARTSNNLTQKELAERTGIDQADISKLEHGTRNPSVKLLQKLADGLNMDLKIEFIPR
jgi:ribosome-binding protein aMBF1 (putative translation factor)